MAVLKYKDPDGSWIPIGVPGVTSHNELDDLDVGDPHPQYLNKTDGGTVVGPLYVIAEPTAANQAASKAYADRVSKPLMQANDPGNPSNVGTSAPRTWLWIDTDEGGTGSSYLSTGGGTVNGSVVITGMLSVPSASSAVNGLRRITISTNAPSAASGQDGDIWFQRVV